MHGPWDHDWVTEMKRHWGRSPWSHRAAGSRGDPWSEMWADWWRGPAPRADRGLVRYLVLDAIASQPRHGYEIIQVIGDKSGGSYRPSPGVVYPTLQMLEELGHACTVARDERKVYAITDAGRRDLEEHAGEVTDFYEGYAVADWERHADDIATVMKRVGRVMRLFKHAMRRGGVRPSTMRKMHGILDDALKKLEDLLSTEAP
ncbi:MAG TPA: PadR family transcriptional regulator [Polyangiaceae bacterium]|nr:PadR family transcriptional regulator [Polyangiaceae bacterium]